MFTALSVPVSQLLGQADTSPTQPATDAVRTDADSAESERLRDLENWATQFVAQQRAELSRMVRDGVVRLASFAAKSVSTLP